MGIREAGCGCADVKPERRAAEQNAHEECDAANSPPHYPGSIHECTARPQGAAARGAPGEESARGFPLAQALDLDRFAGPAREPVNLPPERGDLPAGLHDKGAAGNDAMADRSRGCEANE